MDELIGQLHDGTFSESATGGATSSSVVHKVCLGLKFEVARSSCGPKGYLAEIHFLGSAFFGRVSVNLVGIGVTEMTCERFTQASG
jgi:hypothetical protein